MIITHLRRNAVSYLALVVACSTGTAFAADRIANGSVTTKALAKNAVTSPKIAKAAVRSADIKDGEVTGADVRDGSLTVVDLAPAPAPVPGPVVALRMLDPFGVGDPVAVPDLPISNAFTSPAGSPGGRALVRVFLGAGGVTCSAGTGFGGLYLDDVPVPGTRMSAPPVASARAMEWTAVVQQTPGAHTYRIGYDCPLGAPSGAQNTGQTATLIYLD